LGDNNAQNVDLAANDVYNIPYPINLSNLFFKNKVAAANTAVVIIGTTLTDVRKKIYGI